MSGRPSQKSAKIGLFALFLPFSPFSRRSNKHLGNPENGGKRSFSSDIQARKRHININSFVRLVFFVPGTNPVKNWDTPGFLLILHSGGLISPGLSLGQTRFVPARDKPGLSQGHSRGRRAAQKVDVKKFMCLFRSLDILRFA